MNLKIIKFILVTFFAVITTNSCKSDTKDNVSPYANQTQVAIYAIGFQESNNDQGVVVISIIQTPERQIIIENSAFRYNEKNIDNVRALCEKFYHNLLNNSPSLSGYKNMEDYILQTFQSPKTFKNIAKLKNENLYKLINNQSFSLASLNGKSKSNDFLLSLLSSFIPSAMAQANVNGLLTSYFGALLGVFAGSIASLAGLPFLPALAFGAVVAVGYNYATGQTTSLYDIFPGFGPISQTASTVAFSGGSIANEFRKIFDPISEALGGPNYSPSTPLPTTWEDLIDFFKKWRDNFLKNLPKTNSAKSFGDPHFNTFDGVFYGFHGYGEFIAVKSTIDNFEVQVRHEDSYKTTNSTLTTGLAIHTGEDIVCFVSHPSKIYVNNKLQSEITNLSPLALNAGASITKIDNEFFVKTKNRSEIKVRFSGMYSINYSISLPDVYKSKVFGLFGNFDDNRTNDLQIRNGEYLIKDEQVSFEKLYPYFSDSWRISQQNSLLYYDTNQNTETFTKKDFPKSLATITTEQKANAEIICKSAGITNEPFLSSCIYDVAVTNDPTLASSSIWGQSNNNNISLLPVTIVQEPVNVKRIATRNSASYVLKDNGTLWATGSNHFGQFGIGTDYNEFENKNKFFKIMDGIKDISSGDGSHLLVLKSDNSVWASGYNSRGQIGNGVKNQVAVMTSTKILDNGKRLVTGPYSSFVIKTDNSLWATGENSDGKLGDGTRNDIYTPIKITDNVLEVAAGYLNTLILKTDNTLWGLGSSLYGVLGIPQSIEPNLKPIKLMDDVIMVSTNNKHSMIIKKDNSLWTSGENIHGQLGLGTNSTQFKFVKIMDNVKSIVAGHSNSFALKIDNTLWATGANNKGEFGNGSIKNETSFVKVADGIKFVVTNSSAASTFVIKTDNTIWAAGENGSGQLGDGTTINRTNFIPINVK